MKICKRKATAVGLSKLEISIPPRVAREIMRSCIARSYVVIVVSLLLLAGVASSERLRGVCKEGCSDLSDEESCEAEESKIVRSQNYKNTNVAIDNTSGGIIHVLSMTIATLTPVCNINTV